MAAWQYGVNALMNAVLSLFFAKSITNLQR